jgi:Tfp pilus assembly protein PilX
MRAQQGSALIAVMFILLLISLLGALAIRQGLTSLNIATNSQVNALLFQSADSLFAKLEQATNIEGAALGSMQNPIIFAATTAIDGNEIFICHRPLTDAAVAKDSNNATTVDPDEVGNGATSVDGRGTGYCDLTKDFNSARRAVVSQVAVMVPQDGAQDYAPFEFAPRKTDDDGAKIDEVKRIRTYITSMLPSLSDADLSAVQSECIENRSNDNTDTENQGRETLLDCLARYGVPAKTQVQEYQLTTLFQQRVLK